MCLQQEGAERLCNLNYVIQSNSNFQLDGLEIIRFLFRFWKLLSSVFVAKNHIIFYGKNPENNFYISNESWFSQFILTDGSYEIAQAINALNQIPYTMRLSDVRLKLNLVLLSSKTGQVHFGV